MNEKIVITGMGAITPIGLGVDAYWEALVGGRSGIGLITRFDTSALSVRIAGEIQDESIAQMMPPRLLRQTDAFSQYAYLAAEEALADAGGSLPAEPERTGIVMGTSMSGITTIVSTQEALTNAVHKNVGPRFVPRILGNIAATQISIAHEIKGPSLTVTTACASGGDAIKEAAMLILADEADAVLAVGAESILCPLVIYSLSNTMMLSRMNDRPSEAYRPFDKGHNGFVIGEGGGALVLERESSARARGAVIYAELAGWANTSDAYHVIRPSSGGEGAARCMSLALRKAGLAPDEIGYMNAHGTATKASDDAEAEAILNVFGAHTPPISSTKAATGHMMGASGITEAIACIQALRTGLLPQGLNLSDPAYDMDFITDTPRTAGIYAAMTNAFGFGGQNSSLIFRRY